MKLNDFYKICLQRGKLVEDTNYLLNDVIDIIEKKKSILEILENLKNAEKKVRLVCTGDFSCTQDRRDATEIGNYFGSELKRIQQSQILALLEGENMLSEGIKSLRKLTPSGNFPEGVEEILRNVGLTD